MRAKRDDVEWIEYAASYLDAACILLVAASKTDQSEYEDICPMSRAKRIYIAPAIFLIKHGLELLLKSLSIQLDQEFEKDHNVANLKSHVLKKLDEQLGPHKKSLDANDIKELEDFVSKYMWNTFLRDFTGGSVVAATDNMNEVFRYPEGGSVEIYLSQFFDVEQATLSKILDTLRQDASRLREIGVNIANKVLHIRSTELSSKSLNASIFEDSQA
jgi:hypothetical protein